MKRGSFSLGFLSCLLLMSIPTTAYAAGIIAERCNHRILVDGKEVQMETYAINGNNYVKLRDVGDAVGFNVYWDSELGCVQVEIDKPYTGTAPETRMNNSTVQLPADGSKYIPQVGDVIRCDDGTDYAITDVSRYDGNLFAGGSLGELPAPTCDWSLLDQPHLPDAEVRHYEVQGKEYCFVRNLYETRRMLYTLYNAVGSNSETWQNGAPLLRSDGSQLVRFRLTIPKEETPYSFWPWKAENLTALFNSCPPGEYSLEAWDVYKDGVFQRTEYNVKVK